ncbi:MAG: hypothetical protein M3436_20170 [Pseudomonadota bacterium]|nr:hypothetical protein [Pseudomonadota bacterium]
MNNPNGMRYSSLTLLNPLIRLMPCDVANYFGWAEKIGFKEILYTFAETLEKDHGRIEQRRCWATCDVEWLA